jgi:ATP-binding cassette subfamily F protein 3
MPIATLSNIEKTFGDRVVFEGLNFTIDRGERVGLIGDNGAGKTTLFKVLTSEVQPDSGTVAIARAIKLGHLTQDAVFDPANSLMDEAELAFAELHALSHRLRELEHEMAEHAGERLEKTLKRYQDLQHEFDLAGGYAWRHKLEATLLGVGLEEATWEQNVETLSGGQRSKLNLAKLLIAKPDLLLLDEPTNHLDLAAIEWLEEYLLDFDGAVLLISHDRYLLDRLATRIVWLTLAQLSSYPGNYSAFVKQRELQELTQRRAYDQQQADIAKQQEFIRRFGAGQRSKEAKGREKRLNRLLRSDAMIGAVARDRTIHLAINTDQRAGDRVLDVRDLAKAYGERQLWCDVRFEVKRGERIGIIGPNGSGKTTLLRVLLGEDEADEGVIRWGANLNIGYYDQRLDDFDPDRSIFEEVAGDRVIKDQEVRNVLATMLFRGDDIHKQMGLLSGGERARVALAELLLDKPNVLVLDEPTNHLDINSREALEGALSEFPGTILCVSHDRYFLDRTVQRLLVIRPPQIDDFGDNYSAWLRTASKTPEKSEKSEKSEKKTDANPQAASPASAPVASKPKKDNPYARPFGRLTLHELEQQITDTEIAINECQQQFADGETMKDPNLARNLQAEYEQLNSKLQQLEAEYFAREQ